MPRVTQSREGWHEERRPLSFSGTWSQRLPSAHSSCALAGLLACSPQQLLPCPPPLLHACMGSSDGAEALATGRPLSSGEPHENICVGNLAFTTTEQDLRQVFEPYGTVETIRMMTDRETGRSRGFGFVEMPDSRAAQRAIDALNGTQVAGRALTVNQARPREPRREPRQPRW